jgi:hypothetical protein
MSPGARVHGLRARSAAHLSATTQCVRRTTPFCESGSGGDAHSFGSFERPHGRERRIGLTHHIRRGQQPRRRVARHAPVAHSLKLTTEALRRRLRQLVERETGLAKDGIEDVLR